MQDYLPEYDSNSFDGIFRLDYEENSVGEKKATAISIYTNLQKKKKFLEIFWRTKNIEIHKPMYIVQGGTIIF